MSGKEIDTTDTFDPRHAYTLPDGTRGYVEPRERGAYEQRIEGNKPIVTGRCAGCAGDVEAGDDYVIRYHPNMAGGIFHKCCDPTPTAPGWYGLGEDGEADEQEET